MAIKRSGTDAKKAVGSQKPSVPAPAHSNTTEPPAPDGVWKATALRTVNHKPDGYDVRYEEPVRSKSGTPVRAAIGRDVVTRDTAQMQQIIAARQNSADSKLDYIDRLTIEPGFTFSAHTALAMAEAASAFYEDVEHGERLASQWGFHDVFPIGRRAQIFHDLPIPKSLKEILGRDVQGALAMSDSVIVMGFRGTEQGNLGDLVTDLAVLNPNKTPYGKLHRGFNEAKDLIIGDLLQRLELEWRKDLSAGKTPRPLYLTGHSMGGALATLAAPDVSKLIERMSKEFPSASFDIGGIYTFGAPRPGDAAFADAYTRLPASSKPGASLADRTFGIAILGDPIVRVPNFFYSWSHPAMKNMHAYQARVGEPTERADAIAIEAVSIGEVGKRYGDDTAPSMVAHHRLATYRRLARELVHHPELARPPAEASAPTSNEQ